MTPTPNLTQAVPFLWVRDLTASLRCYVDGLGFAMTKQWAPDGQPRWCWLERDGVALMLQAFWREGANANLPAGPGRVGVLDVPRRAGAVSRVHRVWRGGAAPCCGQWYVGHRTA